MGRAKGTREGAYLLDGGDVEEQQAHVVREQRGDGPYDGDGGAERGCAARAAGRGEGGAEGGRGVRVREEVEVQRGGDDYQDEGRCLRLGGGWVSMKGGKGGGGGLRRRRGGQRRWCSCGGRCSC